MSINQVDLAGFPSGCWRCLCWLWLLSLGVGGDSLLNQAGRLLDGAVARKPASPTGGFLRHHAGFHLTPPWCWALPSPTRRPGRRHCLLLPSWAGIDFLAFAIMAGKRASTIRPPPQIPLLSGRAHRGKRKPSPVRADVPAAAFVPLAYGFALLVPSRHLTRIWAAATPPSADGIPIPGTRGGTHLRLMTMFTMAALFQAHENPYASPCLSSHLSLFPDRLLQQQRRRPSPWSSPNPTAPSSTRRRRETR